MTISPIRLSRTKRTFFTSIGSSFCFSVGLNGGLVDEHDGNILLDRIDPVASDTLQALFVRSKFDIGFA